MKNYLMFLNSAIGILYTVTCTSFFIQTSHTLTVGCGSPSMRILQHCYYGNCLNRGRSLLARKHGKLQDGCNVSIHVLHSVGNYDLKITEIVRRGTSMHGSAIYNLQLTN